MENTQIPTVIINITGGLVQWSASDLPVKLIVLDYDIQDDPEGLPIVEGDPCYVFEGVDADLDAEFVQRIVKQVEA